MNRQDEFSQNSANKIRLVQIMCCILFSVTVTLQPSSAVDITTTCPSSYVESVASQVNCTVNLTTFAKCNNSPTILSFFFTPNGSNTPQSWCSTSIQSCESTISNTNACNNCSCDCLDDTTSTAAEYQLIFTPEQQTYAGGTFSCNISCFSPPVQPASSNVNCAPIGTIMPQPTTQTPTASTNACQTTAQTTSDTTASTNAPTTDTTGGGCPPGSTCAYAVGFGVTVGVMIIIVIIVIVVKVKPC